MLGDLCGAGCCSYESNRPLPFVHRQTCIDDLAQPFAPMHSGSATEQTDRQNKLGGTVVRLINHRFVRTDRSHAYTISRPSSSSRVPAFIPPQGKDLPKIRRSDILPECAVACSCQIRTATTLRCLSFRTLGLLEAILHPARDEDRNGLERAW